MEWLYLVASLASAVAAVLAWTAKLWWSREYAEAKNEIINSKNAQIELLKTEIENLRELTPMKIREYFLSVKQQLEEYIETLNAQLAEARAEVKQKKKMLDSLQAEGAQKGAELERVEREKQAIEQAAQELERQVSALEQEREAPSHIEFRIPSFDFEAIRRSVDAYTQLSQSMSKHVASINWFNISRVARQYQEASATAASITKLWAEASIEKTKSENKDDDESGSNS